MSLIKIEDLGASIKDKAPVLVQILKTFEQYPAIDLVHFCMQSERSQTGSEKSTHISNGVFVVKVCCSGGSL